jgi:hypothetical protein
VELVDDLDGSVADETIHFTWEGKALVIDVNKKNGDKLRKAMEPFATAARPDETVPTATARRRTSTGQSPGKRSRSGSGAPTSTIRAWARENNIDVPDRGRLKPDVLQAWAAAGKPGA